MADFKFKPGEQKIDDAVIIEKTMKIPEQQNPPSVNPSFASSIGAQLAAKGIIIETREPTPIENEIGKLEAIIGKKERNHSGNNRRANGPALARSIDVALGTKSNRETESTDGMTIRRNDNQTEDC